MRARRWTVLLLALVVGGGARAAEERRPAPTMLVIAHPAAPSRALSNAELASIYTAAMRSWPGDGSIVAFNYPPEHPLRQAFDHIVLKMTSEEVGRFWLDQRIRGSARPPRQVPDPALVARLVARIPGAIGYVPPGFAPESVRVLARIVDGKVTSP